jgi:hypothetical protein
MNIPVTLFYLRPGEEWSLTGDSYDGLNWISDTPKPTLAELEAAWPAAHVAELNAAAVANRRAAFQLEADPLFFGWQRGESDQQVWLDKVEEIRLRFPYVEGGV